MLSLVMIQNKPNQAKLECQFGEGWFEKIMIMTYIL